mmetsp:Transcript_39240/g.125977  ORF Transcript_39240/g.125977 Transcript_39240/m.125977 type:complete len:218 (-) Transcript_39240:754-1407(-)
MGDTLIGNAVATAEVELQLGQIFAAGDALSKPGQADVGDAFACGQDEAELAQARREALRHFYQPSIGEGAAPRKRKTEGLSVGVLSQSLTIAAHRALCQNRAEPAVHSKGRPQLSIHAGVLGVTFQRLHVQFRQRPARHGVQDASSVYILGSLRRLHVDGVQCFLNQMRWELLFALRPIVVAVTCSLILDLLLFGCQALCNQCGFVGTMLQVSPCRG